jgi:uncharacterized protein YqeY
MPLRQQIKADLARAMKARENATVSALRLLLAAIDNAEALPENETPMSVEPIVGKLNEAPRKLLSENDIRQILQNERNERLSASVIYTRLGQSAEAERLRAEADLIEFYLTSLSSGQLN